RRLACPCDATALHPVAVVRRTQAAARGGGMIGCESATNRIGTTSIATLRHKSIAGAVDGEDVPRRAGIALDLAAQPADQVIYTARRTQGLISPDVLQQLFAGDNL